MAEFDWGQFTLPDSKDGEGASYMGDWWSDYNQGYKPEGKEAGGAGQTGAASQDFDWGSFDYNEFLGSMKQDLEGKWGEAQEGLQVQQDVGGTLKEEDLGYHWNALKNQWEREQGNQTFGRTQEEMTKLLQAERRSRGLPGEAMGQALELYQEDVNNLLEAEKLNWGVKMKMLLGSIGSAFSGAIGIAEQGKSTADALREQAAALGIESEEQMERITTFIGERMAKVEELGEDAIQTALAGEEAWAQSLMEYEDKSAQKMSMMAVGIHRAAAPVMSQIATGMHADGTPMTAQERTAATFALNYEVGTRVHSAIVPLADEREKTMLAGAQHASSLSQFTAATQQKQAGIHAQEAAQMGGLLLGAQEQGRMYSQMMTSLTMASESALSQSKLQATQLMVMALQQSAQLYEDFNPVSYLAGFMNILAVPRDVWQKDLPFNMEVRAA